MAISRVRKTPTIKTAFFNILRSKYILYALSIIIFVVIWDMSAKMNGRFLPRPWAVVRELINGVNEPIAGKVLFVHLWYSLRRVFIGYAIAVVVGIPTGLLMGYSKLINAWIKPVFDLFKPMPPIAWISLAILWFGIGESSKVFIIVLGAIVPVILNAMNGIRLIDPSLYHAIRMLGGNSRQEIMEVTLPASLPAIFAGLQISLSMAWTTVVAAELMGAREGMGFIIIRGMTVSNPAMIVGGMLVIAVTAWLLSVIMSYLERRLCPWKTELEQ